MNGYPNVVKIDVEYITKFLKEHDIPKSEFAGFLGYSPQWFDQRMKGGTVKWRVAKAILEMYAMDPYKLIISDPSGALLPPRVEEENNAPVASNELVSLLQSIARKLDRLLEMREVS